MSKALLIACAAADVWTCSVKSAFASQNGDKTTATNGDGNKTGGKAADFQARIRQKVDKLELLTRSAKAARSPQELVELAVHNFEKCDQVSRVSLIKVWLSQVSLYDHVRRGGESPATAVDLTAADRQECRQLRDWSRHYASVLNERRRGPTLDLSKWLTGDPNREIDERIANHLNRVAGFLESRFGPGETASRDPSAWLFEARPEFGTEVFWPVPLISAFRERMRDREPNEKGQRVSSAPAQDLVVVLQDLVSYYLQTYSGSQGDVLELWKELLTAYLPVAGGDEAEELAHVVSVLYGESLQTKEAWNSHWPRLLHETSTLRPDLNAIIPPFLEDGKPDWEKLAEDELELLPPEADKPVLEFGVRDRFAVRARVTSNQERNWEDWKAIRSLNDPALNQAYLQQRVHYCVGWKVQSVRSAITPRLAAPDGDLWFHNLVQACRQPDGLMPLTDLRRICGVKIYPELDDHGRPQWTDELSRAKGLKRVTGKLSAAAEGNSILDVELYATTPEACRGRYVGPVEASFAPLANLVRTSRDSLSQELINALDTFYARAQGDRSGREPSPTGEAFVRAVDILYRDVSTDHLPQNLGIALLRDLRQAAGQLMPRLILRPSAFKLGEWECPLDEPGVELECRYDHHAGLRQALEVQTFGYEQGEFAAPARAVVSAGKPPEGYEEILDLLEQNAALEQELGPQVLEIVRDLPRREILNTTSEPTWTELFKLLWPAPASRSDAASRNANPDIQKVREWFRRTVAARQVMVVRDARKGESLGTDQWQLRRHYEEANEARISGQKVEEVVRPLLLLQNRENETAVKLKAVFYVTD